MKIHPVSSLDIPELSPYRTLRRPQEHMDRGIFVAEGEKVVRRLLSSSLTVLSILTTQSWLETLPIDRNSEIDVFVAEKKLLEQIVGFPLHQGVMAVAQVPASRSLEEAIDFSSRRKILVALDGVVSAENVGLIVRNCGAFGVNAILVGPGSSSPFLRRAVRNSMGAIFTVPVFHLQNLDETLKILQTNAGLRVIAADPQQTTSLSDADLTGNICIVFGNEGWGISATIMSLCNERVAIPMSNDTDSLNVAAASAVFLYEARRQNVL